MREEQCVGNVLLDVMDSTCTRISCTLLMLLLKVMTKQAIDVAPVHGGDEPQLLCFSKMVYSRPQRFA